MKTIPELPNQNLFALTPREWEILMHVAADETNAEIADTLCLTLKSVENYHTRIGDKLDLKGPHKLARFARTNRHILAYWWQLVQNKVPLNHLDLLAQSEKPSQVYDPSS